MIAPELTKFHLNGLYEKPYHAIETSCPIFKMHRSNFLDGTIVCTKSGVSHPSTSSVMSASFSTPKCQSFSSS